MQPAVDRDVRIGRAVALAGIAASALLAALNISVGLYVESSSVFATGVEFAGDVLASAVVLVGLIIAGKPADENHPYGHGRIRIAGRLRRRPDPRGRRHRRVLERAARRRRPPSAAVEPGRRSSS